MQYILFLALLLPTIAVSQIIRTKFPSQRRWLNATTLTQVHFCISQCLDLNLQDLEFERPQCYYDKNLKAISSSAVINKTNETKIEVQKISTTVSASDPNSMIINMLNNLHIFQQNPSNQTKIYRVIEGSQTCKVSCPSNITCTGKGIDLKNIDGLTDEQLAARKALGAPTKICGKYYFITAIRASWEQAYHICCGINARLINFESNSKLKCFIDFMKTTFIFRSTFWTGSTDVGCEPREFSWCPSYERISSEITWQTDQPNAPGKQRCITVEYDIGYFGAGLDDQECEEHYRFICEENPIIKTKPKLPKG